MYHKPFKVERTDDGDIYYVSGRGLQVLHAPLLNRDTAFSQEERERLGLTGLLPDTMESIDIQVERAWSQINAQPTAIAKHIVMTALHDRNEVLFFRVVCEHMHESFPIIYDPVIGEAIRKHSHIYRRPRGLYLSIERPDEIDAAFDNLGLGADDVDIIACSDAEEILGIGDWGVAGVDIVIGKLAVYTAAAGVDPSRVIPVGLDVGTNRQELLDDVEYRGLRKPRVRGEAYDAFIDRFVQVVQRRFPNTFLHWEDFGPSNARRLIERYRRELCTFNDDMQGTGAITLGAVLSGVRATGMPLKAHRIVIYGAGTAGVGIADQIRDAMMLEGLSKDEAKSHIWCLASRGLLVERMADGMRDFQEGYARKADEVIGWKRDAAGHIPLDETVSRVRPTILIGTSTCAKAFTEAIVKDMASHCAKPMIFPLSNPTELHEATPTDLIHWTDGRALIATGAPFAPVTYKGICYAIPQANNAMLYPGLGLGIVVSRARRVTDGMIAAAARAVSEMTDISTPGAPLLPLVNDLRQVSAVVAQHVVEKALAEGVAQSQIENIPGEVEKAMWRPVYPVLKIV